MARRKILVIEDDANIRQGVVDALGFKGYQTFEAGDGQRGLDMAVGGDCDLVLLDLVLPRRDGLEILREIRASRPTLPVIVMTARGDESDRVRGLRLGADDYVVKPFSVNELLARVEAVLRRSPERPTDVTEVAIAGAPSQKRAAGGSGTQGCSGKADLARREVRFDDGGRVELSEREAELLRYLACNAGRAISREEILQRVWRLDPRGVDTRTIDMTVARLREKLREPAEPRLLLTVRGKGYMLAGGVEG